MSIKREEKYYDIEESLQQLSNYYYLLILKLI